MDSATEIVIAVPLRQLIKGISYLHSIGLYHGALNKSSSYILVGTTNKSNIGEQVDNFEQSRSYMVKVMGEKNAMKFLKKAIFSVTIGSNDVLNYFQPTIPFLGNGKVSPNLFQDFMVSNLTIHLKRLHLLGARKFIVVGVGPLGCIPFIRAIKLLPSGQCSAEVNELIQGYNTKLNGVLDKLNQELGPDAIFVYANSFDIFMKIIGNYHQYGFEDANEPCCGGNFPPFICFKSSGTNRSSALCADRSKYVFWDAYMIIAKGLLDGDESVSYPINIRELYNFNS